MARLKVFISSVQKELAEERLAVQILLSTDAFLQRHTVPRLFEYAPAPLTPNKKGYLDLLKTCNVCLLILGTKYGDKNDDTGLSATHEEYRLAKERGLPVLPCIKGNRSFQREAATNELFSEIKGDGYTYSRFVSLEDLQKVVRDRLVEHVETTYDVSPTAEDNRDAAQNIAVADLFERQRLDVVEWEALDKELGRRMVASAEEVSESSLSDTAVREQLVDRGYLWFDPETKKHFATAAGILLFAPDPSRAFPHARIQIDAYVGTERTARADDYDFLRGPVTSVLDDAVKFVQRNTRHPMRVVGLRRVRVDEFPETALREALVNAIAHRDYREAGVKVTFEVFHDRVVVTSPGLPAGGQSLTRIASGRGRSRSRNPLLAQGLAWLDAMEDRGTGIMRMMSAMLDHGLDRPTFSLDDGCVVVTLPGPVDDMERIRVSAEKAAELMPPSAEEKLNDRQKQMAGMLIRGEELTSRLCEEQFGVTRDTANRDFKALMAEGIAEPRGRGRSRHYVYKEAG
jgi:ATP-dependent DNA helicase RecG